MGWIVAWYVGDDLLQETLDTLPAAHWYYSDQLPVYDDLDYGMGIHFSMPDKSQTYSVEGDNADLRHYLARLGRRSRCFSRQLRALHYAVRLFVFYYNTRQLYKQQFPNYPSNLIDFVSIPC